MEIKLRPEKLCPCKASLTPTCKLFGKYPKQSMDRPRTKNVVLRLFTRCLDWATLNLPFSIEPGVFTFPPKYAPRVLFLALCPGLGGSIWRGYSSGKKFEIFRQKYKTSKIFCSGAACWGSFPTCKIFSLSISAQPTGLPLKVTTNPRIPLFGVVEGIYRSDPGVGPQKGLNLGEGLLWGRKHVCGAVLPCHLQLRPAPLGSSGAPSVSSALHRTTSRIR